MSNAKIASYGAIAGVISAFGMLFLSAVLSDAAAMGLITVMMILFAATAVIVFGD